MTEKSPGQALDEITAHFAAVNRVRLVVDQLKQMADRMERVAKGLAVSSFDDDATAEAMLKVAMRGGAAPAVSSVAHRLAIDTISKATSIVLGGSEAAPAVTMVDTQSSPAAAKKASAPPRERASSEPMSILEQSSSSAKKDASDDSFFTEDEIRVMNSLHGHHVLHGVELKHTVLQYVRRVLTDARDFVLHSDFTIHANYQRMVGSQAFRKKLFEASVEEFRARTGIAEVLPVSETPPPQAAVTLKETGDGEKARSRPEPASSAVDIAYVPPKNHEVEQLPLGLMPEDAPDFLLSEQQPAAKTSERWEAPFDGVPYSESEEGLRVAETMPASSSESVLADQAAKDDVIAPKPRVRRGYGFHIGLKGDPFAPSDKE